MTRVQRTVLFVAWLGWVFDIMDTALFNFAKTPMMMEMLGASRYRLEGPKTEGLIQTVFLIGWSLGGLFFGILADGWGRTRTLVLTILLYCVLTGLTALCRTPEQVMAARFLAALGIGGEWAAGAALVAESFQDDLRPKASAILQSAAAFGPVFAALANYALVGSSWRWLFVVGIAPAAICVFIRARVVEPSQSLSPASRESRRHTHRHEPSAVFPDSRGLGGAGLVIAMLTELFGDPRLRRNVIVAMLIGVVGITGAGTAPFWIPNLVKEASAGLPDALIMSRVSTATMLLHVGTLLGVFAFPPLAQRIGRRRAFAIFFVCAPLATALALVGGAEYWRLLVLMPLASFFAIGVSAGFVLYFPELFPTRLRATGAGLAYNVGRILSAPVPWLTGLAMGALNGSVAAGVLVAASIYLVGLVVLPFAPETRGQPLES